MKVCQQRVYDAKAIAGIDKRVRLALPGLYPIFAGSFLSKLRGVFKGADGGCAHGHHAPLLGLRPINGLRRLRWNLVPLPMQFVILHFFYSHRLKCAEADVQRDLGDFNPAAPNLLQDLRREVQASRGRGHRSCH